MTTGKFGILGGSFSTYRKTKGLRVRWPSTEWETGPAQKSGGKWESKWKMAPGLKWPKNGHRNGKMVPKMGFWPCLEPFFHFDGHFSAISGRGPFSICFPIFPRIFAPDRFPIL